MKLHLYLFSFTLLFSAFSAHAKRATFVIEIKNHLFYPAELNIPANQKVKLIIINHDKLAEQFESFDLNREKVIFGEARTTIYIGPLPVGKYYYHGEFHANSAQGVIHVTDKIILRGKHAN